jgi:hypothetical protein
MGIAHYFVDPSRVFKLFLLEPNGVEVVDARDVVPVSRLHLNNCAFQLWAQLALCLL